MRLNPKLFFARTVLLAWLSLCIFIYAYTNRLDYIASYTAGFTPSIELFQEHLAQASFSKYAVDLFASLIGISIFTGSFLSIGLFCLQKLKLLSQTPWALLLTGFVLGETIASFFLLSTIITYQLMPIIVAVFLLAGILAGVPAAKTIFAELQIPKLPKNAQKSERLFAILAVSILLLALLYTSTQLSYDATVEYFSHAKIMAVSQKAVFFFYKDRFLVSSLHANILFTAIIQLFGDQAARMLSWVNGLVILGLGLAIGKKAGLSVRARIFFLALMLTSTAFVDLLGDGKVELISTAPILAGIYWMLASRQSPSRSSFLLIGTFLGFAIISRPYNIFLVPVFTILFYLQWAWRNFKEKGKKAGLQTTLPVLWMLPPLLLLGIFHLWQNWLWLGSPIAPLTFAQHLTTDAWQWKFDPNTLNLLRLLYPLTVTFFNTPQSAGGISPLVIGAFPFLLFQTTRHKIPFSQSLKQLAFPALSTLGLWVWIFFTVVELRYVFFLWVMLFLLASQALDAVFTAQIQLGRIFAFFIIILLVFINLRAMVVALAAYSPIDQRGQPQCDDPLCTFWDSINQTAPSGERIFALFAYRYYLRPDLFACSSQANEYPPLETLARENSPVFWTETFRQGFHYIIYENYFAKYHSRFGSLPDPALAPAWLQVKVISTDGINFVYQIDAANPPFVPETKCIQDDTGHWQVISTGAHSLHDRQSHKDGKVKSGQLNLCANAGTGCLRRNTLIADENIPHPIE